jgi:hypothetical protein
MTNQLIELEDDTLRSLCMLWLGCMEYKPAHKDIEKELRKFKNLKPCQVPGQEGAIRERLEWTIDRLEENLAKNAELAAAG